MATNSSSQYIGKIASLISTANIRYEGTIYMINNDTITLKNVRIFGTEDRKCEVFIGVVVDIKPVISFNRSGIQTISLIPQYSFFDPSIADQTPAAMSSEMSGNAMPKGPMNASMPMQRPANRDFYQGNYYRNMPGGIPDPLEEPINNDFDFEESNKKLEKDVDTMESSSPAYKKDDFFDSLQERSEEREMILGRHYRGRDEETFGRRSLDERNRENRKNYRYQNSAPNYGQNRASFQKGQSWGRRGNYYKQTMPPPAGRFDRDVMPGNL